MDRVLKEMIFVLFVFCFAQCIINYTLEQRIKELNMLIGFSYDLILDRENLLNKNGIKYNDYICMQENQE